MQQARPEDVAEVRDAYREAEITAHVAPFFQDLPERIAGSHLVISRAGASTVAEVTAIGRPAILVPLPHAIDNDQLENARRLEDNGGGWCLHQSGITPERSGRASWTSCSATRTSWPRRRTTPGPWAMSMR